MRMKGRRLPRVVSILVLLVGGLAACGGSDPVGPQEIEELTFHPSLGVNLAQMTRTDSGLYYSILAQGTGDDVVEEGESVTFEYEGWFHTGAQFANSDPPAAPYNYIVGNTGPIDARAIAGIDEGVRGMRVNETRLLVIPWILAYGPDGSADRVIPPYANVVFEITVTDIEVP